MFSQDKLFNQNTCFWPQENKALNNKALNNAKMCQSSHCKLFCQIFCLAVRSKIEQLH
jgi:hypothetical protein